MYIVTVFSRIARARGLLQTRTFLVTSFSVKGKLFFLVFLGVFIICRSSISDELALLQNKDLLIKKNIIDKCVL